MARTVRFRTCVLLLLAVLLVSPAMAAGRKTSEKRESSVISLLWRALGKFVPTLEKSRGSMDPDGSPAPASTTTPGNDGDSRGSMDPDG